MNEIKVFVSYSHEDKMYLDELKKYIEDCKCIKIWDDSKILPGKKWDAEIKGHLLNADIVLLMISQSFLRSTYIHNTELEVAMERNNQGKCWVIPIFTRPCILEDHPDIPAYQGLPLGMKFLSDMGEERHSHYVEIQKKINEIANEIRTSRNISNEISSKGKDLQQAKVIEHLKSKNKIFLSLPDSETGKKKRKDFLYQVEGKIKYEKWPYEIVPDISESQELYEKSPEELTGYLTAFMDESIYSIHILSSEEELKEGLSKLQFDLAKQAIINNSLFKSIIWLLDTERKEKPDIEISMNPNIAGNDYESLFELIKSLDDEKEKKITELRKNFSPEKKIFMFYDFSKDHNSEFRIHLKTKIEENENISVRFNAPNDNLIKEKEDLEKCEAALIFYGSADSQWFLMHQSLLLDAPNICTKAVCLDEPDIKIKIDRDVIKNEFQTIQGQADLETGLKLFLNRLQK